MLELGSYAGYVLLFQRVFGRVDGISFRRSCEITLAGVAATRLLATAGAGGIALTGWALRRSGMPRAAIVSGLTTFFAVLYSIYMAALVVAGLGLSSGLLPGPAPFGLTVVPAVFGRGRVHRARCGARRASAARCACAPRDPGPGASRWGVASAGRCGCCGPATSASRAAPDTSRCGGVGAVAAGDRDVGFGATKEPRSWRWLSYRRRLRAAIGPGSPRQPAARTSHRARWR